MKNQTQLDLQLTGSSSDVAASGLDPRIEKTLGMYDRRRNFLKRVREFSPELFNARRQFSKVTWDLATYPDVGSLSNWIRGIIARGFRPCQYSPARAFDFRVRRTAPGVYQLEFVEMNDWS